MWVNERFAATNRDHRGVTFRRGPEAIIEWHDVLEGGGIFANAAATGAGQVASMQWLQLQDGRELVSPAKLLGNDVGCDLSRQRQRKPHSAMDSNDEVSAVNAHTAAPLPWPVAHQSVN